MSNEIYNQVTTDEGKLVLLELADAGLLDKTRNAFGVPLLTDELSIEFTPNKLNVSDIKSGTVTTKEIGFTVSSRKTKLPLSDKAQR